MKTSENTAQLMREMILNMSFKAQASHIGSSLSCVDILAVFYSILESQSIASGDTCRPDLIFSKGHAAMAQYSALAAFGLLDRTTLESYGENESPLSGHVSHLVSECIPLSTGSLGHGLPYGVGLALAYKLQGITRKVVVLMSDGEMDEGTTWESALIANHFKLDNLLVIVDRNKIQSLGSTETTIQLEPLADKWLSFNWQVNAIDGHNHEDLRSAIEATMGLTCIIANTVKGRGVSFMEDKVLWHYRPPNAEEFEKAHNELLKDF